MMPRHLTMLALILSLPAAAAHYLTDIETIDLGDVEDLSPTKVHCIQAHEPLGHCRSSNFSVTADVTATVSASYSSNGSALGSSSSVWTGQSLALAVTLQQRAPPNESTTYTISVDDTVGIYWTGAKNVTLTLRGDDSGTATFPLSTPSSWFDGDRVFPYVRIGADDAWDGLFTTLAFDDPAIGGESVGEPRRLPPAAELILLVMVVGAVVLAYTRGRWG